MNRVDPFVADSTHEIKSIREECIRAQHCAFVQIEQGRAVPGRWPNPAFLFSRSAAAEARALRAQIAEAVKSASHPVDARDETRARKRLLIASSALRALWSELYEPPPEVP